MKKCNHKWEKSLPKLAKKNISNAKDYEFCPKCFTSRRRVYNSSVRNWKYKYRKG